MYGNTLWTDFDRAFFRPLRRLAIPELVRELERATSDRSVQDGALTLRDDGDSLELLALLPGIVEDDIDLSVHGDVLSLRAERQLDHATAERTADDSESRVRVHRSERRPWSLQRTVSLPVRVDPERTRATLDNGVLRVTLAKAASERPRKIAVTAV